MRKVLNYRAEISTVAMVFFFFSNRET